MEVLDATQLYIVDTTVYSEGTTTGREDAPQKQKERKWQRGFGYFSE